ncbi:hypothetical protein [Nodosilinea nodulosa]|uniref:hypothetical protein n=1 Tax=Nodosilinea nodulosa TaxID=416001 RepID=UPI0003693373|nr:hypothetical protein [Nodosilinea nodulosa]
MKAAFTLSLGIIGFAPAGNGWAALTESSTPALAQVEPNQDNLQMQCPGSILVNDINYTVFFTREAGFSRIVLRRRSTGQQIAEAFLSYDRKNAKGQAIWRGAVNGAADVTLVHLSARPAQRGDQVSVGYDGQWGRGTCQ